jgi:hypothetical protein
LPFGRIDVRLSTDSRHDNSTLISAMMQKQLYFPSALRIHEVLEPMRLHTFGEMVTG